MVAMNVRQLNQGIIYHGYPFQQGSFPRLIRGVTSDNDVGLVTREFQVDTTRLIPNGFTILRPFTSLLTRVGQEGGVIVHRPFIVRSGVQRLTTNSRQSGQIVSRVRRSSVRFQITFRDVTRFPFRTTCLFRNTRSVHIIICNNFSGGGISFPFQGSIVLRTRKAQDHPNQASTYFCPFRLYVERALL